MTDVVLLCDRGKRLALGRPRQNFGLLMLSELGLPSEPNTASLGSDPPFVGSAQDQIAYELGQSAKDCQHQPAVRGRGVGPRITQRLEARPSFADCGQRVGMKGLVATRR